MNKKSSVVAIGSVAVAVVIVVAVFMFSEISDNPDPMNSLVEDANENSVALHDAKKIKILASFYPYEFTRNVASDFAIVEQYMPSGIEAHSWKPRAQEIQH